MPDKMTRAQFAKSIKGKYPQYASMPDDQLVDSIFAKYPQYRENVLDVAPTGNAKISAPPTGMAAVKSTVNTFAQNVGDKIVENLPTIGATVGALAGAPAGPAASIGGAALGGAAGKAAQQIEAFSRGKGPKTSGEAAGAIVLEGTIQGAFELGGMGIAKVFKMIAPAERSALLAYGSKTGELGERQLNRLIPEFDKTLAMQGSRGAKTIGEFEKVVTSTQSRLGNEYGLAMQPIAGQKYIPIDVSNAIKAAKRTPKTKADIAFNKVLDRRALEFENQEWTLRELDQHRSILAKRNLAGKERQSITNVLADTKLDAETAADKAANKALNEIIYPKLDVAAGKPAGYFADLQSKQSTLYTMRDLVQKSKRSLVKGELEEEGAPALSKMHLRGYLRPNTLRPGGVAGIPLTASGKDLAKANKAIARSFPSPTRKVGNVARKAVSLPFSNATIDALPIRVLWEAANADEPPQPKTPAQMKRDLKAIRDRQTPQPSSNPF